MLNEIKDIILASSSKRRIAMLKENGVTPVIIPPQCNENLPQGISMEQAVMYLALKKALSVEKELFRGKSINFETKELVKLDDFQSSPLLIAADTVVYKTHIIGKPSNKEEALENFTELRNTFHYVATGVAMLYPKTAKRKVFCEITKVFFNDYTNTDIQEYISTDEPWDKAGGYAIQGAWRKHVHHYEGDLNNIIGFPLSRIQLELTNFSCN